MDALNTNLTQPVLMTRKRRITQTQDEIHVKQIQQQERRTICEDMDILYERYFVVSSDFILFYVNIKYGDFGISNSPKMGMSAVCIDNTG